MRVYISPPRIITSRLWGTLSYFLGGFIYFFLRHTMESLLLAITYYTYFWTKCWVTGWAGLHWTPLRLNMKARAPVVLKNVTHSLNKCQGHLVSCPGQLKKLELYKGSDKVYFVPINEANEDGEFLARIHLRKIAQLQSRRKNWSFSGAENEMEKTLLKLNFGENPQKAKSFCTAASVFNWF